MGYQISPLLWKKVRRGLSAGRVQSVAVRLIVEREREIKAFVPVEYWTLEAELRGQVAAAVPRQAGEAGREEGRGPTGRPPTRSWSRSSEGATTRSRPSTRRERRRNAPAPFITCKLQQEAANRLGFTAKKTMTLAQRLYEGVELGDEGQTALITYMRTDSVRLSDDAVKAARDVHRRHATARSTCPTSRWSTRAKKSAQDAHEAIRPMSLEYPPERVRPFLEPDMFRLYELIWNRFVACQMKPAVYDQTTADISAGRATFRAAGSILKFAGLPGGVRRRRRTTEEETGRREGQGADEDAGRRGQRASCPSSPRATAEARGRGSSPSSTSPSRRRASPRPRW